MAKKASQAEVKNMLETFTEMPIDQQTEVLAKLNEVHNTAKNARAQELMAELRSLGLAPNGGAVRPKGATRASPKVTHRGPNGETWSSRGAIPKWAKEAGVTDRDGMERFRVAE